MADSPIHLILNEIRINYSGKKCSLIDVRNIENQYNICSILNTRSDGIASLRITSFGLKQVVFEDISVNLSHISFDEKNLHDYIFNLNKSLYDVAYGIDLIDDNIGLIDDYKKPNIDFYTMQDEIMKLKEKCTELEKQLKNTKKSDRQQISLFE